MTLVATGTFEKEAKVQYIRTLVCGEVLCQFDLLSADVKNTETLLYLDYLLKGLAWYFPRKFNFKTETCNAPLY